MENIYYMYLILYLCNHSFKKNLKETFHFSTVLYNLGISLCQDKINCRKKMLTQDYLHEKKLIE